MKKSYKKPIVILHDFSLSTNIAAGCELKTNLPSKNACGYPTRGGVVFMSKETGCEYVPPEDADTDGVYDTYNGYCYHVPAEANNLFNS